MDTLKEADKIINGERQDQYGDPENSFKSIAEVWQWYLNNRPSPELCLDAKDVAIMMTLFKIARMCGQVWKRDNAIDAAGYLAILNDRLTCE